MNLLFRPPFFPATRLLQWTLLISLFCGAGPAASAAALPKVFAAITILEHGPFGTGFQVYCLADGELVSRKIDVYQQKLGGHPERRCRIQLDAAEMQQLREVLTKHHFFNLVNHKGTAVADATVIYIDMKPPRGKTASKSRPVGYMEDDFLAIYNYLRSLGDKAQKSPPFYDGLLEENWKPAGFE